MPTSTSVLGSGAARADLLGVPPVPGGKVAMLLARCTAPASVPVLDPLCLRLRL